MPEKGDFLPGSEAMRRLAEDVLGKPQAHTAETIIQQPEFKEALLPKKIFFHPGCSPEFINNTLLAYTKYHNEQAIAIKDIEEGKVDIIISEFNGSIDKKEQLQELIEAYRGKNNDFKSIIPVITVSGPDLSLSKDLLARFAFHKIRHLENPSPDQLACAVGALIDLQTYLQEMTVQLLAKRTDEAGNGKNIFLTSDNQTVEDGFYFLSEQNNANLFITGGQFGNGKTVKNKISFCKSSQKGCQFAEQGKACEFCFTGRADFKGNLTAQEIVDGFLLAYLDNPYSKLVSRKEEENPTTVLHVSFMGEGEPLYNLDEVLKAIRILNNKFPWITFSFSTVGIKKGIEQLLNNEDLADISLQPQLSVHFADERREKRMPAATGENNIRETLPLMFKLAKKLNHKLTLNMMMFGGPSEWQNNTEKDARNLTSLVKSLCGKDAFKYIRVKISEFNGGPGDMTAGDNKEFIAALRSDVGGDLDCQELPTLGKKVHSSCGSLIGKDINEQLIQIKDASESD